MRAVNLLPRDQRRGSRGASRGSVLGYGVVGLLVAVLIGVVMLVLTGNQIDERKSELASAEQRQAELAAQVEALRPYTDFAALATAREQTIRQLAMSRFDWERVLKELALVLPDDVWLTTLTGTVSPAVQVEGGAAVALRASVDAPALEMVGCATSKDAVARLVNVLRDIDGVTRVGLDSSERTDAEAGAGGGGEGGTDGGDCRTRDFISEFQLVVAFDAATAAGSGTAEAAPPAAAPTSPQPPAEDPAAEVEGEQQVTEASAAEASDGANTATGVAAKVTP